GTAVRADRGQGGERAVEQVTVGCGNLRHDAPCGGRREAGAVPGGWGGVAGRSAAAVGGLDLVDVDVAGPVDRVGGGAGDRVAGGRRRPVLDANGPAGPPGQRGGDVP